MDALGLAEAGQPLEVPAGHHLVLPGTRLAPHATVLEKLVVWEALPELDPRPEELGLLAGHPLDQVAAWTPELVTPGPGLVVGDVLELRVGGAWNDEYALEQMALGTLLWVWVEPALPGKAAQERQAIFIATPWPW